MSVGNAIKFIRNVQKDDDFRKSLYKVNSFEDFESTLREREMYFNPDEYEEAFNHLHVQCQDSQEADDLYNVNHFIRLLY